MQAGSECSERLDRPVTGEKRIIALKIERASERAWLNEEF